MAARRTRRRPPGTGSIRFRADTGRYQAGLTVDYNDAGNPIRLRKDFDTYEEADLWLATQRVAQARGELLVNHNQTVAERIDGWLDSIESKVTERTFHDYRTTLLRYVRPHLGGVRLKDLKPLHIDQFLTALNKDGRTPYTVEKAHRYLSMVLIHAVELELVARNVARHVRPAAPSKRPAPRWSTDEAQRVLAHCVRTEHPVARYIVLGLTTGLRREELLGLRWSSIDLAERHLEVNNTVTFIDGRAVESPAAKTPKGFRIVYFDETAAAALMEQLEYIQTARAAANEWVDRDLVFSSTLGTPLSESFLRRHFKRICETTKVTSIRINDLRSTHGSILADAGVNPKLISERLGHANVGFTMDVYVRTQVREQRAVAGAFASAVQWQPVAEVAATPALEAPEEAAA